jgi:predicted nucleic acid-binding protein
VAYSAVLDACVLYPASLRDVLLRFAHAEFYDVLWSARILDEAERNLIADGRVSAEGARRLRSRMAEAFDGACVGAAAIAGLELAMTNDPKDRHVLAAAVASQAQAVITTNLKDFPETASAPYGIEVLHPDEFLIVLYGLDPRLAVGIITEQAGALQNPPMTVQELLDKLTLTVPAFVAAIRSHLPTDLIPVVLPLRPRRARDEPGAT